MTKPDINVVSDFCGYNNDIDCNDDNNKNKNSNDIGNDDHSDNDDTNHNNDNKKTDPTDPRTRQTGQNCGSKRQRPVSTCPGRYSYQFYIVQLLRANSRVDCSIQADAFLFIILTTKLNVNLTTSHQLQYYKELPQSKIDDFWIPVQFPIFLKYSALNIMFSTFYVS